MVLEREIRWRRLLKVHSIRALDLDRGLESQKIDVPFVCVSLQIY